MKLRFAAWVLVWAVLGGSTGLVLALHLHTEAGHDPHQCDTCELLLHQPGAVVDEPASVSVVPAPAADLTVFPDLIPHSDRPSSALGPRAPPFLA